MNKSRVRKLNKGDFVTIKEAQKAYNGAGTIQPGDRIKVNDSDAPYVYHIPGNDSGFLAGWWLRDDGQECPCGIPWDNVQAI